MKKQAVTEQRRLADVVPPTSGGAAHGPVRTTDAERLAGSSHNLAGSSRLRPHVQLRTTCKRRRDAIPKGDHRSVIAMYVCICNGLTERHVRDAVEAGALQPGDVYQSFGCEMQCGTCENAVACIVERIAGPASGPACVGGHTGDHDVTFAGQAAAALS